MYQRVPACTRGLLVLLADFYRLCSKSIFEEDSFEAVVDPVHTPTSGAVNSWLGSTVSSELWVITALLILFAVGTV